MCQPLPYADFRWVDDISNFNVMNVALDSPTGYILEVDLEYPQHLHDAYADLLFCPTRDKPPSKRKNKLFATLYNKKHIHYIYIIETCSNVFVMVFGGQAPLTKIHRISKFVQSPWLRDYIQLNTDFRTRTNNDFEKNLYK